MRRGRQGQLFRLRRVLFEAGMVDLPAQHRREGGPATRNARLAAVAAPELRRTLLAYLDVRATVLRPKTIDKLTSALAIFGEFICDHDPDVHGVADLRRRHIEAFLAWTAMRTGRGSHDPNRTVGDYVHAHAAIVVRAFLDDIATWGWADTPGHRLVFDADIPRQPDTLPRALPPDMAAPSWPPSPTSTTASPVSPSPCCATPGCASVSSWISSSITSSTTASTAPGCASRWASCITNAPSPSTTSPSTPSRTGSLTAPPIGPGHTHADGHLADFVFVERGRRLGTTRIQRGLRDAVTAAGLTGPDDEPLRTTRQPAATARVIRSPRQPFDPRHQRSTIRAQRPRHGPNAGYRLVDVGGHENLPTGGHEPLPAGGDAR
jgi:hypothetical protein